MASQPNSPSRMMQVVKSPARIVQAIFSFIPWMSTIGNDTNESYVKPNQTYILEHSPDSTKDDSLSRRLQDLSLEEPIFHSTPNGEPFPQATMSDGLVSDSLSRMSIPSLSI